MSRAAFAPGNISCIFGIYKNKDPRWAGSVGMGFTINEGVTSKVSSSSKNEIFLNGKRISFPTVRDSLASLSGEKLKVELKTKLPLGCGFGLSGASALACLYSANEFLSLGKNGKELAIIAHTCEVINKTGLGDVVNQFYGGFLLKTVPSSCFEVVKLPIAGPVYCRHFGKLLTKSIISKTGMLRAINNSADDSIEDIKSIIKKRKISFADAADASYHFAVGSGLLSDRKTKATVESARKKGGHASMIMLGKSVFCDTKFKGAKKFMISRKGACLL
jgi:pantoate kinase